MHEYDDTDDRVTVSKLNCLKIPPFQTT